jgi:hypothetical protein
VKSRKIADMEETAIDSIRRMAGLATPMTLRVAVTLGLPDRLLGNGASPEQLAAQLDVCSVALDRLISHLVTIGVAERTPDGYRTTAFGANLCADADNGLMYRSSPPGKPCPDHRARHRPIRRKRVRPVDARDLRRRERSVDEFRDLTAHHGLALDSVTGLTSQRCLLEFTLAQP